MNDGEMEESYTLQKNATNSTTNTPIDLDELVSQFGASFACLNVVYMPINRTCTCIDASDYYSLL